MSSGTALVSIFKIFAVSSDFNFEMKVVSICEKHNRGEIVMVSRKENFMECSLVRKDKVMREDFN